MTTSRSEGRISRWPRESSNRGALGNRCVAAIEVIAALALILFTGACQCGSESVEPTPTAAARPAEAPAALVFVGAVPAPQRLWERVRAGLGPPGQALPKHYPLLLTELLAVSPVVTGRFEGEHPVRFAVSAPADELAWAVAIKLLSGGELVAELSTGASAPYRAEVEGALVRLQRPGVDEYPARGVSRNYLLLASDQRALLALGPYLASTALEEQLQAPVDGLVLEAAPNAGPGLASLWRRAVAAQRTGLLERVQSLLGASASAGMTRLAASLFDAVSSSIERALDGEPRSRVSALVQGSRLRLSAAMQVAAPWVAAPQACDVAARAPFANVLAALIWAAPGEFELPRSTRGASVAGDAADSRPALLTAPGLLGAAEVDGEIHGFAQFGKGHAMQPLAAVTETLLAELGQGAARFERQSSAASTKSDARVAGTTVLWKRVAPPGAPALVVALAERERRARWAFGGQAEGLVASWGKGTANSGSWPWSRECSRLLFALTAGQSERAVSAWALTTPAGFEILADVPLELFVERWLSRP